MLWLQRAFLLLPIALGGAGCSFAFVDAPPKDHAQRRYFDCTSGRLAPVTDTVMASLLGLSTMAIVSDSQNSSSSKDLVYSMLVTAGFAASAIRGYVATGDCRQAKQDLQYRLLVQEPPVLPPPTRWQVDPWLSGGPPPGYPEPPPPPSKPDPAPTDEDPATTDGASQP